MVSHWSTVYAGRVDSIAKALTKNEDPDPRYLVGSVELSGITELDLDVLMQLVGGNSFPSYVEETIARTDDTVAYRLSPAWVSLFAALDRARIDDFVGQWTAQLPGESDLEACAASVRELSLLCARTRDRGVGVVYTWNA